MSRTCHNLIIKKQQKSFPLILNRKKHFTEFRLDTNSVNKKDQPGSLLNLEF